MKQKGQSMGHQINNSVNLMLGLLRVYWKLGVVVVLDGL